MTSAALSPSAAGRRSLKNAAVFWYAVAAAGQLAFVLYMVAHYLRLWLIGQSERWVDTAVVGYVAQDPTGNALFGLHIALGALLTSSGLLQLIPQIRARIPALHRWNGRLFVVTSVVISLGGLWLIWVRGAVSATSTGVSVSVNGALIIVFALLAWRNARARRFAVHRKWALRAFLMINGVWFFRVGTTAWVLANGGEEVGLGANFDGPFVFWWHWGAIIVPLAALEMYFYAAETGTPRTKRMIAVGLTLLAVIMAAGIVTAFVFLWLPWI